MRNRYIVVCSLAVKKKICDEVIIIVVVKPCGHDERMAHTHTVPSSEILIILYDARLYMCVWTLRALAMLVCVFVLAEYCMGLPHTV